MAQPQPEGGLRVLIVDDDVELCRLMQDFLQRQGWAITTVHDGTEGLRRAQSGDVDVITLDVMLPGIDGFEVLRQLRARSRVPVIMLTARIAVEDRISGLEAVADHYLPKPFHPAELVARIRAVLRRGQPNRTPETLDAGGVRLHPSRREADCAGVRLSLTTAEFDVLELLMRRRGLVVSRDDLSQALYQRPASAYERSTDVHVSNLRRKLETAGVDPIRTVRGVGYLFSAD